MNYCPNCHVYVDQSLVQCPLCRERMTDEPTVNPLYPDAARGAKKTAPDGGFFRDLLILLSVIFIACSIVFNIIYWQGTPWFLVIATPILYTGIVLRTLVFGDYYFGTRVFLQLLGLTAMFLSIDYVAGWKGWSLNFVFPVLLTACNILIDSYSGVFKSRWKDNLMYALLFAVLGCLPLIFYCTHITRYFFPMLLSTVSSAVSVLGMLRFAYRNLVRELKKRFHI